MIERTALNGAVAEAAPEAESQALQGIDYIELYVGNAFQAAHFYRTAFGFAIRAYAGLETGLRDRCSYVLEQGSVRLVLTSGLRPEDSVSQHVNLHGDGVRDVAFSVPDVHALFDRATSRGARAVEEPVALEDASGVVVKATIGAFGDTIHTFVQRSGYTGPFAPGFRAVEDAPAPRPVGITGVDHVAVSMEEGTLAEWVDFYIEVMGFHESHHEMVWTPRSRMNSKVMEDASGSIKFPLVEPTGGDGTSQIEEYLNFHRGCGTQHVAFECVDICAAVAAVRAAGVGFVHTPASYYDELEARVGTLEPAFKAALAQNGVLMDRDDWGVLMQTFTKPLQPRPTMFAELIERQGARGFGAGNIKALFEAVEREQMARGNL
jgi:4-hydroxyphenylpyruvate dioxygenase